MSSQPGSAHHLYYGWYVVAGAFLTSFTSLGIIYSFGVFFTPLSSTFTGSHAAISGILSATLFIKALFGAVAGRIADRSGPRRVVAAAGIVLCLGLVLGSRASALWQLYALYSVGLGLAGGALYVTGLEVVEQWFQRRRGEASGLALTGVAIGNLGIPPLAAALIHLIGWRSTFVVMGLAALGLTLIATALLSPSPQARGVPAQDGIASTSGGTPQWTLGRALRARPFWLLYAAIAACSFGYYIPFAELVPYAESHGISAVTAALLVGLIGAGSLVARLLSGLSDHVSRRKMWGGAFAGMALMLLWWLGARTLPSMVVLTVGFGLSGGVFFTLIGPLAADYFGTRATGSILGILLTGLAPGSLLGPILAGLAFDLQHSYLLPLVAGAGLNLLALVCVLYLGAATKTAAMATSSVRVPRPEE